MMTKGMLSSCTSIKKERLSEIEECKSEMTKEESIKLSNFFNKSESYLKNNIELSFPQRYQNLIGILLFIISLAYSIFGFYLYIQTKSPIPFYIIDIIFAIVLIALLIIKRRANAKYLYCMDLIAIFTNLFFVTLFLSQI